MDPTSGKIRALVRSGFPVHRIATGVQLLAEAHWASTSVEQGHGSAATLHRLRKQYGANMLCQRSMLHMLRHLLFDTDSAEKLTVKEDKREHALLRRKVNIWGADSCSWQNSWRQLKSRPRAGRGRLLRQL